MHPRYGCRSLDFYVTQMSKHLTGFFAVQTFSSYLLLGGVFKIYIENMSGCNKSPKSGQHSIKYRLNQHGVLPFEVDLSCVDYKPSVSNNESKQCYKSSELISPDILSTSQLISAIGHIWDSASRPLSFLLPKEQVNENDQCFLKEKTLDNFDEKRHGVYSKNNTSAAGYGSNIVQEKLDFPKVTQKMLVLKSCNKSEDYIHSLFKAFLLANNSNSNEYCKEMELGSEELSFRSRNLYWWMSRNYLKGLKYHTKVTEPVSVTTSSPVAGGTISKDTSTPPLNNDSDVCNPDLITHEGEGLSLSNDNDAILDMREVSPLCSDYFLQVAPDTKADVGACQAQFSSIYVDYHINSTCSNASVPCQQKIDDNVLLETQRRHFLDITDDELEAQISSATLQKPCYSLAKQEYAFSGALAGICVSLCLHPVDTIKTVIQSCRAEQSSILYIGKSIVSDRGLPGLYRGIATNIACSAPISAVYTFTYESVKVGLIPYLPKEYYSFAHCVGGGCASIATSFIFTPSERIKQQLQVGSHYRNCWDALVGIIRNGGFLSLYAGWGAVLCRNVPHSIIKLVCGGLAGSTAALFTTPFDVIKTRLQTQIPGSINQYTGVFHALYKISKSEGFKGLYRGLTPRLIMYMSQGSLFFASYEFFKMVFSLEPPHSTCLYIQNNDKNIEERKNSESTIPPPEVPSTASPSFDSLRS